MLTWAKHAQKTDGAKTSTFLSASNENISAKEFGTKNAKSSFSLRFKKLVSRTELKLRSDIFHTSSLFFFIWFFSPAREKIRPLQIKTGTAAASDEILDWKSIRDFSFKKSPQMMMNHFSKQTDEKATKFQLKLLYREGHQSSCPSAWLINARNSARLGAGGA